MSAPLDGLEPWDGQWRVAKPADYTPGLYRWHQVTTFDLLKSGAPLSEWSARFLQTVAYQSRDLSPVQSFWLNRLEREIGRLAA